MRFHLLVNLTTSLVVLIAITPSLAQEGLGKETLEAVKAATVLVSVEFGKRSGGTSGSGFLVNAEKDVGFVATNAHVVAPRGIIPKRITIVLHSGTQRERCVEASVVGIDRKQDLAVLRLALRDLPTPIALNTSASLRETMTVYVLGFPFGRVLSDTDRYPAVTVSKGTVSSLRRNRFGEIARIQIDGDLNPGNSGGPIVTTDGEVVGVATAEIDGTQIGFATPTHALNAMLAGRPGSISFDEKKPAEGSHRLRVRLLLIDPMHKIKAASILIIPKSRVRGEPKPDERGNWIMAFNEMIEHHLVRTDNVAVAEIPVSSDPQTFLFQTKYIRADGTVVYTQPGHVSSGFDETSDKEPSTKE